MQIFPRCLHSHSSDLEQCVWLNGPWFICGEVLARHWPRAPRWLIINGNDLADPRIAAFRVAVCNNGSLAREKVKMDILVPSDYIFSSSY